MNHFPSSFCHSGSVPPPPTINKTPIPCGWCWSGRWWRTRCRVSRRLHTVGVCVCVCFLLANPFVPPRPPISSRSPASRISRLTLAAHSASAPSRQWCSVWMVLRPGWTAASTGRAAKREKKRRDKRVKTDADRSINYYFIIKHCLEKRLLLRLLSSSDGQKVAEASTWG